MFKNSDRNYWLLSLALFSFFLTWSFSFSLFPIWLNQAAGLNGENMGIIFSLNAVAALFIMPFYGFIQDKLGLKNICCNGLVFYSSPADHFLFMSMRLFWPLIFI
ncbi:MFS transporter [Psychrosphaera sp. G1-22]|uniref:MFS transporter n=1 Tax=Psychrosphaera algicola TaxID=3023714 RepID=A0ABT5F7S5_9GAMM|nr:MFS transporter [Psychrosphaera sp. G1-22]MDC2887592.1 MFS transporter [Psychrosphaera sp. G1-22]